MNYNLKTKNKKQMKSNYTMLNAINKDEAAASILNVLKENPIWLNKVSGSLVAILKAIDEDEREFLLQKQIDEHVIDLFVKMKEQEYHFKDVTQWNY